MNERRTYVAEEGPLSYRRVLYEAWGMLRRHYLRVALVALIIFVPPPLLTALLVGGTLAGGLVSLFRRLLCRP